MPSNEGQLTSTSTARGSHVCFSFFFFTLSRTTVSSPPPSPNPTRAHVSTIHVAVGAMLRSSDVPSRLGALAKMATAASRPARSAKNANLGPTFSRRKPKTLGALARTARAPASPRPSSSFRNEKVGARLRETLSVRMEGAAETSFSMRSASIPHVSRRKKNFAASVSGSSVNTEGYLAITFAAASLETFERSAASAGRMDLSTSLVNTCGCFRSVARVWTTPKQHSTRKNS